MNRDIKGPHALAAEARRKAAEAEALRANLKRRKLQLRGREALADEALAASVLDFWFGPPDDPTREDFRDAWFVGYTSTLVAGIWLGNDDGSPTKHLSGATLPTDIWQKFMLAALKGTQPQPLPGLNTSWSLDIPALLGLSSKDEPAPADEPMVEPSRSQNQPLRTPALPQSNLVPPAPVPQASVPQTQVPVPAPVRSNPDGRPLQIVPQTPAASVMAPPPDVRAPANRPQDPRELRPPAMVGGGNEPPRQPVRREPSVLDRLFGG